MPDIPISGHKLFDALWNVEYRVQKETPKLEPDGTVSTTPILSVVAEARSCKGPADCLWSHVVQAGGEPCNRCRNLVLGDYYRKA